MRIGRCRDDHVRPPSCAEITRFAEQLVDVAITYNYDPSDSPSELAAMVDVVFAGVLTSGFESGVGQWDEFVSYGIEVTEVATGADVVAEGDEVYVSVDYNQAVTQSAAFEEAVAVGAPVVVLPTRLLAAVHSWRPCRRGS